MLIIQHHSQLKYDKSVDAHRLLKIICFFFKPMTKRDRNSSIDLPAACKGVQRSRSFALTSPPYSINNFKICSLLSIEHWWIGVNPSSFDVFGWYFPDWRSARTSSMSCLAVANWHENDVRDLRFQRLFLPSSSTMFSGNLTAVRFDREWWTFDFPLTKPVVIDVLLPGIDASLCSQFLSCCCRRRRACFKRSCAVIFSNSNISWTSSEWSISLLFK